jgi:hypothetical protein
MIHFNPDDLELSVEPGIFNLVMGTLLHQGISRLLDQKRELEEKELKEWLGSMDDLLAQRIQNTADKISDTQEEIDGIRARLRESYRNLDSLKDTLAYRKKFSHMAWRKKEVDDYKSCKHLIPESYCSISFKPGSIEAVTDRIEIEYNGGSYVIGRFVVTVDIIRSEIVFRNMENKIDGFHHPHVNTDGTPCWGNLEGDAIKLLTQDDYCALLVIAIELLRSYNPHNPFIRIENWDPDWSDEEDERRRYEDCSESASSEDCVRCSDDNCPYQSDAESRCRDNKDYPDDCKACSINHCSYHTRAISDCQDDRIDEPSRCVSCDIACVYSGSRSACFEVHQGESCGDCDVEECSYRPAEEEDNHEAVVG